MTAMTAWVYDVQLDGEVSEPVLASIQAEVGTVLATTEPATTVIRGSVADPSGLVGLLDLLHAHGLQVCELRRVNDLDSEPDAGASLESGSGMGSG